MFTNQPSPHAAQGVVADGFLTYASFAADPARRRKAGWRIGQQESLSAEEASALIATAPTHLATEAPVPRYVADKERAELIHRAVWSPAPWDSQTHVFSHATPAGNDASGRPNNVFTSLYVFRGATPVPVHPALLLGSDDLLVPFNAEVNKQTVAGPGISVNAELSPRAAAERLMRRTRRGFNAIRTFAATVLDCVAVSNRVVIADDPRNAADWLVLITLALPPGQARRVSFSTYERAGTLIRAGRPEVDISVVPAADAAELRSANFGAAVIDAAGSLTRGTWEEAPTSYGDSSDDQVEVSELSALYEHIVTSPHAADALAENPAEAEGIADKVALLALKGTGTAQDVLDGPVRRVVERSGAASPLRAVYREVTGEEAGEHPPGDTPAAAEPAVPRASISGDNPFDDFSGSPAPEPAPAGDRPPAGRLRVDVRVNSAEQQKAMLESVHPGNATRVGDHDICWGRMGEFLLLDAPPGSREEDHQIEIFAAAAVRRLLAEPGPAPYPPLPYWRLLTGERPEMCKKALQRAAELIEGFSARYPDYRDRLFRIAAELGRTRSQPANANPEFAAFLDILSKNQVPSAPPRQHFQPRRGPATAG